jgi:Protein of unknown function (DUF3467)
VAGNGDTSKIALPIEFLESDVRTNAATNIVVQHTEHEFFISFYEIHPPLILGEGEERRHAAEAVKSVSARCVARIIVAGDRMPEFVEVLERNLEKYRKQKEQK